MIRRTRNSLSGDDKSKCVFICHCFLGNSSLMYVATLSHANLYVYGKLKTRPVLTNLVLVMVQETILQKPFHLIVLFAYLFQSLVISRSDCT